MQTCINATVLTLQYTSNYYIMVHYAIYIPCAIAQQGLCAWFWLGLSVLPPLFGSFARLRNFQGLVLLLKDRFHTKTGCRRLRTAATMQKLFKRHFLVFCGQSASICEKSVQTADAIHELVCGRWTDVERTCFFCTV